MRVAQDRISTFQTRAGYTFERFRQHVAFLATEPGPLCRTFNRTEHSSPSPEFERIVEEFEEMCRWARTLAATLPLQMPVPAVSLPADFLGARPRIVLASLAETMSGVDKALAFYNEDALRVAKLGTDSKETHFDRWLVLAMPFWFALALALRITKVTGELRLP